MHAKLNFSVCQVFTEAMFLFVAARVGTRRRARLVRSPDKCRCQLSQSAPRCPADLKPSGNGAHNWPPVFIPDTLLSISNAAAAEVTSGESALWEGEMKEQARRGGERERSIPPFPFIVPYERRSGHKSVPALKNYI